MKQIAVTAGATAQPAPAPAALPTTGGEDGPAGLLLVALGLLLGGTLLSLRVRRRA
jgi:LPXTG-motif cell wall-anchored protein